MTENISAPERHENLPSPEKHELLTPKASPEKAEAAVETALSPQEARTAVAESVQSDTQSDPRERLKEAQDTSRGPDPTYINRELKQITLRRELQQIRRKLPAPQRALSRVIHQPAIRMVSEVAGKTVSRPSGLLGGGLMAFVGSAIYLYLTKHVGFEYNYSLFLLLFAGGFVLGLLLEFIIYVLVGRRKPHD